MEKRDTYMLISGFHKDVANNLVLDFWYNIW